MDGVGCGGGTVRRWMGGWHRTPERALVQNGETQGQEEGDGPIRAEGLQIHEAAVLTEGRIHGKGVEDVLAAVAVQARSRLPFRLRQHALEGELHETLPFGVAEHEQHGLVAAALVLAPGLCVMVAGHEKPVAGWGDEHPPVAEAHERWLAPDLFEAVRGLAVLRPDPVEQVALVIRLLAHDQGEPRVGGDGICAPRYLARAAAELAGGGSGEANEAAER